MRLEARYAGPRTDAEAIRRLAGCEANCLQYGVTNHYLDVAEGGFARPAMGSPRLRLRVYESGRFRFGQLEHKRQVSPAHTVKSVWPCEQVWDLLLSAMPWLAVVSIAQPPRDHELAVLLPPVPEPRPEFGSLTYVRSLSYSRVSCAADGVRVTADSGFTPAVVPPDTMIVETKGDRTLPEPALRALDLNPLAVSKFALLSRVAA